ncbi:MAG: hypothetical protein O3B64_02375 [bacterium]|nr:hypothetical protein [bacterium]
MKTRLDAIKTYELDESDINFGIERLSDQLLQAWEGMAQISLPKSYRDVENVVIVGMGGSALGAQLLWYGWLDQLSVPVEIVNNYTLPAHVGSKTLLVLSSYSGNTEEILEALKQARKTKAKLFVIASGGKLKSAAIRYKIPYYCFDPGELAPKPRLAVGFSLGAMTGLMSALGCVKLGKDAKEEMLMAMEEVVSVSSMHVKEKKNPAKTVAAELHGRELLIVAADHLIGNAHVLRNQIHETAKQYAHFLTLPELNHHLLEGMSHPKLAIENMTVLMIRSELYHARTKKRFDITAGVFEEQGARVVEYDTGGPSNEAEVAEVLQWGSFLAYYMAMMNDLDPGEIPFVDRFKAELG